MADVRITCLVENSVYKRGLCAEHGLSFWIEHRGRHILFDTGPDDVLIGNAGVLNCDLTLTDTIVLSHGHGDHTGGLRHLFDIAELRPEGKLHAHAAAFEPKYSTSGGTSHQIGMPNFCPENIRHAGWRWLATEGPVEVAPGIFASGPIPRHVQLEEEIGRFWLDSDATVPDPLEDDQCLYFDTNEGLVILLGCTHAGLINTLSYIRKIAKRQRIHAVIGGLHLGDASRERLAMTLTAIGEYGVEFIAPCHCTGLEAVGALWFRFPNRCGQCSVGTVFEF